MNDHSSVMQARQSSVVTLLAIEVAGVNIEQDAQGRYSLGDLHKAAVANGETKDIRPNEWLSLRQTQDLAEILITEYSGIKPIEATAGRYGGTFVVKELVYAYAMWISPAFNLKVIRAYDKPSQLSPAEMTLLVIGNLQSEIASQQQVIEQQKPSVEFVDKYVSGAGLKGFRQVCKLLNAKEPQFREFLTEKKIQYWLNDAWTAHSSHITAGRFSTVTGEANGRAFTEIKFTPKGVNWVAGLWAQYQLEVSL